MSKQLFYFTLGTAATLATIGFSQTVIANDSSSIQHLSQKEKQEIVDEVIEQLEKEGKCFGECCNHEDQVQEQQETAYCEIIYDEYGNMTLVETVPDPNFIYDYLVDEYGNQQYINGKPVMIPVAPTYEQQYQEPTQETEPPIENVTEDLEQETPVENQDTQNDQQEPTEDVQENVDEEVNQDQTVEENQNDAAEEIPGETDMPNEEDKIDTPIEEKYFEGDASEYLKEYVEGGNHEWYIDNDNNNKLVLDDNYAYLRPFVDSDPITPDRLILDIEEGDAVPDKYFLTFSNFPDYPEWFIGYKEPNTEKEDKK